jgi:hypothetical protein
VAGWRHRRFLVEVRYTHGLQSIFKDRDGLVAGLVKASEGEDVRHAALLVAVFTVVVGIVGLISPDRGTTVRRLYFATPVGLYAAAAVRVAMGLVMILCASTSRAPKTLRALGAVMCRQALAATLLGPDRARAVLEWETMQGTALLRVGATVALATGSLVAFAVSGHRPKLRAKHSSPLPGDR